MFKGRFSRSTALAALWVMALIPSCGGGKAGKLTVVASLYPLAFVAEELGGGEVEVIDLTPPGSEAHDVDVSFQDRASVERADLVLYLGDIGFQPQIERTVREAAGEVLVAAPSLGKTNSGPDPHIWLDPVEFGHVVRRVAGGLARVDEEHRGRYGAPTGALLSRLQRLDERYRQTLTRCASRTLLVTHEAFGYLADRYRLAQLGLAGVSPEGEPTAEPLLQAETLVRSGQVAAIFYEETDEGRRIATTAATDLGVAALPLATLESRPSEGDFLSVMEANLASLAKGLRCG